MPAVILALNDHREMVVLSALLTSRALILWQDMLQDLGLLAVVVVITDRLHDGGVPLHVVMADAAPAHPSRRVPRHMLLFILLPLLALQLASMTLLEVDMLRPTILVVQILYLIVEAAQIDHPGRLPGFTLDRARAA